MIKYAITDPSFFNPYNGKNYLKKLNCDYLLFRDKKTKNYKNDAKVFIEATNNYPFQKVIHQDYVLAKELNINYVHLTSNQFEDIKKAKDLKLKVIISTHSIAEIKKAKKFGADIVTFSPIFATANKGKPKGLEKLKKAIECCEIKVIALGGIISQEQLDKIKKLNPYGFASIRYFT